MLLATDLIAIVIALVGCLTMMGLFFKQNLELRKENLKLINELWEQNELR
jgi:uncharacterized integral membrane protein